MTEMYWYVSRQKVDSLAPQLKAPRLDWLKELSLTLKSPFAEAKVAVGPNSTSFGALRRVEAGLKKSQLVAEFPNLDHKVFFSFRLKAHRAVQGGAYFVVAAGDGVAVLLAGSLSNAIGMPPKESDAISPSVDPLGCIRRAFAELSQEESKHVGNDCGYVWASLAGPMSQICESLPEVEGIAVYGAAFAPPVAWFRQANFDGIDSMVVGSPIFVRQI